MNALLASTCLPRDVCGIVCRYATASMWGFALPNVRAIYSAPSSSWLSGRQLTVVCAVDSSESATSRYVRAELELCVEGRYRSVVKQTDPVIVNTGNYASDRGTGIVGTYGDHGVSGNWFASQGILQLSVMHMLQVGGCDSHLVAELVWWGGECKLWMGGGMIWIAADLARGPPPISITLSCYERRSIEGKEVLPQPPSRSWNCPSASILAACVDDCGVFSALCHTPHGQILYRFTSDRDGYERDTLPLLGLEDVCVKDLFISSSSGMAFGCHLEDLIVFVLGRNRLFGATTLSIFCGRRAAPGNGCSPVVCLPLWTVKDRIGFVDHDAALCYLYDQHGVYVVSLPCLAA